VVLVLLVLLIVVGSRILGMGSGWCLLVGGFVGVGRGFVCLV